MRKARVLSILFVVVLLAVDVIAAAQQPKKVFRIGYLSAGNAAGESTRSDAIRLALRELGYIEGQNIAIEYRYTEGKVDRHPELAAELVRLKVDVILVTGSDALIQAAKNTTKIIPIVMMGSATDPIEAGHVESLARPGGNVTGLSLLPEFSDDAREIFADPDNEIFLSSVSAWEIAVKYALCRLPLPEPPGRFVPLQRKQHGIDPLQLDEEAALHLSRLPLLHKDPFDRMLVSQAVVHHLAILTSDELIHQYPVRTLW